MRPTRVAEVLREMIGTRWPIFVWGPPGVGKSSVVQQIARELEFDLIDIRASLLDPTDLRGIPMVQDGRAVWCPPTFLPSGGGKPGILFFDELSAAPSLVQASLYQLTLDRRVGEYELPPNWHILAAGNRAGDFSVSYRMPSALANRFVHIEFEVDFEDWRAWATSAGVNSLVIGFLGTRPELLLNMSPEDRAFPSPRSWEMASDAMRGMGGPKSARDVIPGIVGEGAAIEFAAYCEGAMSEEQIRAIMKAPKSAALPAKIGDQYALVSYVGANAHKKSVQTAAAVLVNRLPPEMGVLMLRDILKVAATFTRTKGYRQFIKEHGETLL
jgi:hypothetical protein